MGYANADLLRKWTRARREGSPLLAEFEKLIEASQAACPHNEGDLLTSYLKQDTRPTEKYPNGKFKAGDELVTCKRCSLMVYNKYRPRPPAQPRKTVWELLMEDD